MFVLILYMIFWQFIIKPFCALFNRKAINNFCILHKQLFCYRLWGLVNYKHPFNHFEKFIFFLLKVILFQLY